MMGQLIVIVQNSLEVHQQHGMLGLGQPRGSVQKPIRVMLKQRVVPRQIPNLTHGLPQTHDMRAFTHGMEGGFIFSDDPH